MNPVAVASCIHTNQLLQEKKGHLFHALTRLTAEATANTTDTSTGSDYTIRKLKPFDC